MVRAGYWENSIFADWLRVLSNTGRMQLFYVNLSINYLNYINLRQQITSPKDGELVFIPLCNAHPRIS